MAADPGAPVPGEAQGAAPSDSAAPDWMNAPAPHAGSYRSGHVPPASQGPLHLLGFFGLIVVVVALVGLVAVTLWGPEKKATHRTQFATHPPAPMALPSSLSAEPAPADPPAPAAEGVAEPPAPAVDAKPPPKRPKKGKAAVTTTTKS